MEHRSFFNGDGFVQLRFLGLYVQESIQREHDALLACAHQVSCIGI